MRFARRVMYSTFSADPFGLMQLAQWSTIEPVDNMAGEVSDMIAGFVIQSIVGMPTSKLPGTNLP
jgi:hypothetical protein